MKILRIFLSLYLFAFSIYYCGSQPITGNNQFTKNCEAFTKLYGYIRFFHPSDEAQKIDWERFAVYGMQKVSDSENDEEVRRNLLELFLPIAPSLQITRTGDNIPYENSLFMPADTGGFKRVFWQHYGVYLGNDKNIYKSARVNTVTEGSTDDFGGISQYVDAENLRGKKIKLKGFVKAEVKGGQNTGNLWLRVDRENGVMGFFDNMWDRPVKLNSWNEYEITGDVAMDALYVMFGCFLNGQGKIWVDELRLFVSDSGKWNEVKIKDSEFEIKDMDGQGLYWKGGNEKYSYQITDSEKYLGNSSFMIWLNSEVIHQSKIFDKEPYNGEKFRAKISENLSCTFPLVLFADDNGTFPRTYTSLLAELNRNIESNTKDELTANDKFVRLGDICIAWNIFQHFYPYFKIVGTNWDEVLPEYLKLALESADEFEFHKVLMEFIAELKDGHGRVGFNKNKQSNYPPVILDYAEGKVVVSRILDQKSTWPVMEGDEVIEIDGMKTAEKMKQLSKYISSATPQWLMHRLLNETLISGKVGTEFNIKIKTEDGTEEFISMKRDIPIDVLVKNGWYAEYRPDDIKEIKKGIFYVDLDRASMSKIDSNISKLANAKGVIFDMRGYPKGNHDVLRYLTDSSIHSAFFSVNEVIYPDRVEPVVIDTSSRWNLGPLEPRFKGKIVFLVNGNAISYAESVMGIVEAYKLGTIVGEPTAGTNGNVNPFNLPGGFYISWTGMNVVKHNGSPHHGVGIIPDILVNRTIKGIREKRDEFLEKALELIEK
jgi:C-terminal processing protease CtpA/Prc